MPDLSKTPMSVVIAMANDSGTFDSQVAEQLTTAIGAKTVGEIGTTKFELTLLLGEMPGAMDVAGRLLDFMRQAELIGLPTAAPAASVTSQTVQVVMPTHRRDMSLPELLKELFEHPEDLTELTELIRQQPAVQAARVKLRGGENWAIATGRGANRHLDVEATLRLVRSLGTPGELVQEFFEGHLPVALEDAFSSRTRLMIYPFGNSYATMLFNGTDPYSNDWRRLDPEVYEAIIDAVASGALRISCEADAIRITGELFGDTLPSYLRTIVNRYQRRKEAGQVNVSRYATPQQIADFQRGAESTGGRRPFDRLAQPERNEAWYEARLRELAAMEQPACTVHGNIKLSTCVVSRATSTYGNIVLDNVIIVDGASAQFGSIRGDGWTCPGSRVSTNFGNVSRDIKHAPTWKMAYDKAVEYGIITE